MMEFKPHVLGVDDGPFERGQERLVPVVGVMMECPNLVESVAMTHWPADLEDATDRMSSWVASLRCSSTLQALIVGGITVAGLGILDVRRLSEALARPVLVVNRKDPAESRLHEALSAAGLEDRLEILARSPASVRLAQGIHLAWAGTDRAGAQRLFEACAGKARLPEPLRIAHLIARALVRGESRGRV